MSSRANRLLSIAVIVCLLPAGGRVRAAEHEPALAETLTQGLMQEPDGLSAAGFGQRDARCGGALALDGERLLIGCSDYDSPAGTDTGAAFVFVRNGATWALEARLLASDAGPTPARPGAVLLPDGFGSSVSVSGDVAVVGALFDDHAGGMDAGAAYVFVRSGSSWTEQQKLIAADAAADDRFGGAVSVAGETVVVGAFRADHAGGVDAGAAYIFVRSGESWKQQQKLVAVADPTAHDNFGVAVAAAGDTVIVGARHDDPAGREDAGAAHVFVRSGTRWSAQQLLVAADGAPKDRFGAAVALASDTAVVGAAGNDHGGREDAGAAYVFVRARGKWAQQQKLVAPDAGADDGFGHEVSVEGDTVLVGALHAGDAAAMDAGAAYAFVRTGTRWVGQQKLMAADPAEEDRLGAAVALSGDTAATGAFLDDHDGIDAGSTYVFVRTGSRWSQQHKVVASATAVGSRPAITAADREGSSVTLRVLHEVGMAMMDWATAAEREPGRRTAPAKVAPDGTNWSQCPPISHQELGPVLAGFLDGELPREDGWGHPLEFCLDRDGGVPFGIGVRSPGRDGRFEGADYARLGKFDPLDIDRDIVWLDSLFVAWPQK